MNTKPELDDDEDEEFLKQVENFESSFIETPVSSKKKPLVDLNNLSKNDSINNAKKCLNNEFSQDKSSDDELLANEDISKIFNSSVDIKSPKSQKNATIEEEEEENENDSEINQKYIDVLKRYFGYSSFRKLILSLKFFIPNCININYTFYI